ncbi:DNA primase small subunit-like [Gigantopelta aegis]|uniref:DNA primase small subunit-like n=1 Tax=Gigantopelta aegis TaxID=1735272 RepID=UPI001B889147|nr:DNA primase small subunit-like [Gigantopelta aegis]
MNSNKYDPAELPDLLPIYYKRLFPYGPYYRWLHYGGVPKHYFTNREFSFTLKDDVYIRYQSFPDQQDLEKEIQKRCPYKIDIGAVFSHRPKDHKTVKAAAFQAQEKELVFDIDMTDYDDVRNCCSQNAHPQHSVEDFGYDHLLWVYSGRRGIHCWVCDKGARKLSQTARSAIAEYLTVVKGGDNQTRKVTLDEHMHPHVSRSFDIIEEYFTEYAVRKQDFLEDEQKWTKVLALVPDETLRESLMTDFKKVGTSSSSRWAILKQRISECHAKGLFRKSRNVVQEIMLQYCYPRLDVNVSKGVNHLLKSPFCIHPKTGRVCVPMDQDHIDSFDPASVPTISNLVEELNQLETGTTKIKDYKRTSLGPTIDVFERFLKKLENTWKGKLIEQSDMKREF